MREDPIARLRHLLILWFDLREGHYQFAGTEAALRDLITFLKRLLTVEVSLLDPSVFVSSPFLSVAFEAAALPTIEWINRTAARALGFEEKKI